MFPVSRPMRWTLLSLIALALLPATASATWSVIAIDARTGRIIVASATCVPQGRFAGFPAKGLMDIQAIVVPGIGVAAAQAGVDNTRENQRLIYQQLKAGTHPEQILELLTADPRIERRQFGIVDRQGRSAGFSGSGNGDASLSWQARVPGTDIYYSVQGNILASEAVVHDAARALEQTEGSLADRVMAAMEAADTAGGDVRCTAMKAQWDSHSAPSATQVLRLSICSMVSCFFDFGGGMTSSGSLEVIRRTNSLPSTLSASTTALAPSFVSKRRSASRCS